MSTQTDCKKQVWDKRGDVNTGCMLCYINEYLLGVLTALRVHVSVLMRDEHWSTRYWHKVMCRTCFWTLQEKKNQGWGWRETRRETDSERRFAKQLVTVEAAVVFIGDSAYFLFLLRQKISVMSHFYRKGNSRESSHVTGREHPSCWVVGRDEEWFVSSDDPQCFVFLV